MTRRLAAVLAAALAAPVARAGSVTELCVDCHDLRTRGIVQDWKLSRHSRAGVGCETCHGEGHLREDDAAKALLPTPGTCAPCHPQRVEQFERGKHARAWSAVKAMPAFHGSREATPGDPAGCVACHRIGLKSEAETKALHDAGMSHGFASCDACHTRHLFSKAEARRPEACRTCHGGSDNLQWEAWTASKHGVRYQLLTTGVVPEGAAAPTCQRCPMPNGDHAVRAPWGSLGLRLPLPDDAAWAADRAVLFRALGVLGTGGADGPRVRAVQEAGMAHLDKLDYDNERFRLTQTCQGCHGPPFVREQLDRRDGLLRESDRLCADAVREVAKLHEAGLLPPTANGKFPDLVLADLASPIERKLAAMFFQDRARLVATAFHMSPKFVEWRSALARDLEEIGRMAVELRRSPKRRTATK
jgi:hypothetical protein